MSVWPAVQSAGCWSLSAGPWWRPAPPAASPVPPSVWRSVPQPSRCSAPPVAPPPGVETPEGRTDRQTERQTVRKLQIESTTSTTSTLLHLRLYQCGSNLKTTSAFYAQWGGISIKNAFNNHFYFRFLNEPSPYTFCKRGSTVWNTLDILMTWC